MWQPGPSAFGQRQVQPQEPKSISSDAFPAATLASTLPKRPDGASWPVPHAVYEARRPARIGPSRWSTR